MPHLGEKVVGIFRVNRSFRVDLPEPFGPAIILKRFAGGWFDIRLHMAIGEFAHDFAFVEDDYGKTGGECFIDGFFACLGGTFSQEPCFVIGFWKGDVSCFVLEHCSVDYSKIHGVRT